MCAFVLLESVEEYLWSEIIGEACVIRLLVVIEILPSFMEGLGYHSNSVMRDDMHVEGRFGGSIGNFVSD